MYIEEEMETPSDIASSDKGLNDLNILGDQNNHDVSAEKTFSYQLNKNDSSDEDAIPRSRTRKRIQELSDSDVEKEISGTNNDENREFSGKNEANTEDRLGSFRNGCAKSRIEIGDDTSDSDLPEKCDVINEHTLRLNNKRNKLKQKFKCFLSSRSKSTSVQNKSDKGSLETDNSNSENSDSEMSSIATIKQKIKKSLATIQSVCDPDTSDEESNINNKITHNKRQKNVKKSIKMIEAKPLKMSAKQAMENMQLIKSESNRMLREKSVSLPYHRPKALSLKDVLSKRKPAISSDGKALPIKMNEEQLKQYALQLEQRQKEMMELCKSESDEDITDSEETAQVQEDKKTINQIEDLNDMGKTVEDVAYNTDNKEITPTTQNGSENIASIEVDLPDIDCVKDVCDNRNELTNYSDNQTSSNVDLNLAYNNDSIEEESTVLDTSVDTTKNFTLNKTTNLVAENNDEDNNDQGHILQGFSEHDSQSIHLNYPDTEETANPNDTTNCESSNKTDLNTTSDEIDIGLDDKQDDFLSDDDVNMEDIDRLIISATIMQGEDEINSSIAAKNPLDMKPKLSGVPGMVINLDNTEPILQKRSGVELLKEKFSYFSKLKTPEELEREREKRQKPGAQHLKLKQDLENKIAEQRSLEWAKRLEEEKQHHQEMDAILDDADNSIEKMESKLDEQDLDEESDSDNEEELIEDNIEIKDKPRKHNPMVDDEAEESDIGEDERETDLQQVEPMEEDIDDADENIEEDNDDSSDEDTSESEEEDQTPLVRKSRILKAFEDSDDENTINKHSESDVIKDTENKNEIKADIEPCTKYCEITNSLEDDVIQLAQKHSSVTEDIFISQENSAPNNGDNVGNEISDEVLGTQTFSISSAKPSEFLYTSQPYHDPNIKIISEGLSQNLLGSQLLVSESSQSQPIGEDILAMCTGKFYDSEFVSQGRENEVESTSQDLNKEDNVLDNNLNKEICIPDIATLSAQDVSTVVDKPIENKDKNKFESEGTNNNVGHILKSILDELHDPEFDKQKPNIFFTGGQNKNDATDTHQMKKRLIIDSDDETNDANVAVKGKKKLKKKKLEDRALQISDDEDEGEEDLELDDEYESGLEDDTERVVEYDSEENEIEVKLDKPKKKRKTTDFFEQEAELTSEDEWVGSGDEDERGLDRMEREEGDDEVFHQGKLRKELGQIHMRDVLDQDKREVRLLQELLFEDGDLGGGHRQRKFRWRNADDDEVGTIPGEFADTQEEFEFESEEQWRKQRHEREVFLKQMHKDDDDSELNVTVDRTTIIKANLSSKSMSTLLMEVNQTKVETTSNVAVLEKKAVKDIPSPKKQFSILQQNYHGSLLTRGRGALARLAALATPLAVDDDAPKISSLAPHKRNFVFTAVTPVDDAPKVTMKRKADVSTPKLVKKMRIEEKRHSRSSLLDHFKL